VIGLIFVYAAVIGNIRQIPAKPSRVVNLLVFGGSGLALVLGAFVLIREAGGSFVTGAILGLAVILALVGFEFSQWMKFRGADSWPAAQGTIESLDVKEVRTRSAHYFALDAAYSYSVNGEYYSGRFAKSFETESEASDYAASLKGRPVSVRYKAADAGTSCLRDH
jgi:multisubunit Na+/H+ antiporter MnhB subunit